MRPYIPHSLPPQGGKEPLLSSRLAFWYALTVTEIRVLAQSCQLQLAIWRSNAFAFAFHNVGVRFIGPEEGLDESSPYKFWLFRFFRKDHNIWWHIAMAKMRIRERK